MRNVLSSQAIMMDLDHLLLDLDKAAMRYYLNKNTSDDDVKPAPNVSVAVQMLPKPDTSAFGSFALVWLDHVLNIAVD